MKIRALQRSDYDNVARIHKQYWKDEFALPDFVTKYFSAIAVVDDNDDIITVIAARDIAEFITITDKSKDNHVKLEALYNGLSAAMLVAQKTGYSQIHAFVQDPIWAKRLKKIGFKPIKGEGLVMEIT